MQLNIFLQLNQFFRSSEKKKSDVQLNESLVLAAKKNTLDWAQYCVSRGADLNALKGQPLLTAVQEKAYDVMDFLLAQGANPRINEHAALKKAAYDGNLHMVQMLVKHGAIPECGIDSAIEAIEYRSQCKEVYQWLLAAQIRQNEVAQLKKAVSETFGLKRVPVKATKPRL